MTRRNENTNTTRPRNMDKYDRPAESWDSKPGILNALTETVLNPFFVLGRR